jgi:hypothetical protein
MTKLDTFISLSPGERRLLMTAFPLVIMVRLALWAFPSRFIVQRVRRLGLERAGTGVRRATVADLTWAVEAASRRIPHASCLTQAVAAQLLLRRNGWTSQLCLGVARRGAEGFFAHAWIEHEGKVVLGGGGLRDLTRLPDLAAADASFGSHKVGLGR